MTLDRAWLTRAQTAAFSALLAGPLSLQPAAAQDQPGFQLSQLRMAEVATDGFSVSHAEDLGHGDVGLQLNLHYANDPLVIETDLGDGETRRVNIVNNHLTADLSLAVGLLDRIVIFGGLPFSLVMNGSAPSSELPGFASATPDGNGIGDPWFGSRVRLLGGGSSPFAFGAQLTGTLPLAHLRKESQNYLGDRGFTIAPELLGTYRTPHLSLTANLGMRVREEVRLRELSINEELTYGFGIAVPFAHQRLRAHLELFGSTTLNDTAESSKIFNRETSPAQALLGFKGFTDEGFVLGVAAGAGIIRGVGAPDFTVVGTIGFASGRSKK